MQWVRVLCCSVAVLQSGLYVGTPCNAAARRAARPSITHLALATVLTQQFHIVKTVRDCRPGYVWAARCSPGPGALSPMQGRAGAREGGMFIWIRPAAMLSYCASLPDSHKPQAGPFTARHCYSSHQSQSDKLGNNAVRRFFYTVSHSFAMRKGKGKY